MAFDDDDEIGAAAQRKLDRAVARALKALELKRARDVYEREDEPRRDDEVPLSFYSSDAEPGCSCF